jgi:hypothetical protein
MTSEFETPEGRLALIERVGPAEYNKRLQEYHKQNTLLIVSGYPIRHVYSSRFGYLWMVDGTNHAFLTVEQASAFARSQPERP